MIACVVIETVLIVQQSTVDMDFYAFYLFKWKSLYTKIAYIFVTERNSVSYNKINYI